MFTWADDERVESLLSGAGFSDVLIEDVSLRFVFGGIEEYVRTTRDTGGAFSRAFDGVAEEEQAAITNELEEAFAPFAVDGGLVLPGVALVALAR